jgi:prepilin-type N-terminal cleavage/methylation domain-containing protein
MKKTNGFSLMETMIVLLIVSVIAAASAPMINKKMVSAASDKSPWVWVGTNKNIAYNLMNRDRTASIGTTDNGKAGARLHILTDDKPQISLGYKNSNDWRLFANDSSLNLSTSENTPDSSVAIGSSVTPADNSVVVGSGAQAGASGVAIGHYAKNIEGQNSIVIGAGNTFQEQTILVKGNNSIAIGYNSRVGTENGRVLDNATALGAYSQAQNSNAIAIGYKAKVPTFTWKGQTIDRTSATAIGAFAEAAGNYSIALGGGIDGNANTQTKAAGDSSIAIGRGADSTAASTIAIGRASVSNGSKAIAIGSKTDDSNSTGAEAVGDSSIAIGSRAYAEDDYSIAIGGGSGGNANTQTKAEGNSSIAIGRGAESTAASTIAIGRASVSNGSGAIAIGSKTDDDGTTTFTSATALNAIAIGRGADATAENSIAIGSASVAGPVTYNFPTGAVTSNAENAIAIGYDAKARYKDSVAIGTSAVANHENQITLGNENSIVYIPGKLVVKKDSYLSVGEGYTTYVKVYERNNNTSTGRGMISLRFDKTIYNNKRISLLETGGAANYGTLYKEANQNQINKLLSGDEISDALSLSDRRLKDVGKAFKGGLEEIKKLEVFNYTFKKDKSKTPRVGVMAQDLEKIFPNAVFKGEDGFLRIRMEDIFYAMVNAIKELDSKISILEQKQKKIDELESKVTKLEKRLADLEKKIK